MADNIAGLYRNTRRAEAHVLAIIKNSAFDSIGASDAAQPVHKNKKQRVWYSVGVPSVDAGSQATYPLAISDWAIDTTNNNAYIVTVAPTANTAATLVLCNVTNA